MFKNSVLILFFPVLLYAMENPAVNLTARFNAARELFRIEKATYTVSAAAASSGTVSLAGLVFPERISRSSVLRLDSSEIQLPAKFDWREFHCVSAVKDQKSSCFGCWSFTLCGMLESQILMKDSIEVDLSEQDLINCNQNGYNCRNGGFLDAAKNFLDGAALEQDCPYLDADGECRKDLQRPYKIRDWKYLSLSLNSPPQVEVIKQAIMQYGPVGCGVGQTTPLDFTAAVFTITKPCPWSNLITQ
ncbi:MAG: C1 family peptidase [Candidatus Wallbacteria bacterium]|nr:C1 family peptidase [Candidatus Wallbacteria bacterium]